MCDMTDNLEEAKDVVDAAVTLAEQGIPITARSSHVLREAITYIEAEQAKQRQLAEELEGVLMEAEPGLFPEELDTIGRVLDHLRG